ncbi:SNF2 family N-terminal domain-containing protein [Xylariales sp. PMI_506]|nr:SNF2 family N-terminal domain-containing protein [Xylariales sp. PMI_506]
MDPYAKGLKSDRFEIEDDDEFDEIIQSIPCSSPYFTQPTQIVNRATQPTQIVNRTTQPTQIVSRTTQPTQIIEKRTTLQRSSPPIPDTPSSAIEVPASSPFRADSQNQRSSASAPSPGGRLASLMAPAGTIFRAPPPVITRRAPPALNNQRLNMLPSDDDLSNDYQRQDSSDDDNTRPMRGEIRPSSLIKKQDPSKPFSRPGLKVQEEKDITFNDIPDLRLRYLTKQTHKVVNKVRPGTTVLKCKNALQKFHLSAEDAINHLIGDARNSSLPSKSKVDSFASGDPATAERTAPSGRAQQSWTQTKLTGRPEDKSRRNSSSPPPSPEVAKNTAPRKRLMRGRRNRSPSPPQVFSVSSSHQNSSIATTPQNSSPESTPKMGVSNLSAGESQSQEVVSRRRLQHSKMDMQGEEVISIESDSDTDDLDLPQLTSIKFNKRKSSPVPETEQIRKKPRRLVPAGSVRARTAVRTKVVDLTEDTDNFSTAVVVEDDSDSGSDELIKSAVERDIVLEYLNKCSAEELSRMTGVGIAHCRLVVSSRPFGHLEEVQNVKIKGAKRSKKTDIGSGIVQQLDDWFTAFDAVTTVINACDKRGAELQSVMSKWEMDKDGKLKDDKDSASSLVPLPISKRPSLMAEDVKLKSYQLFGLNWMNLLHDFGYSGILADDMGLGKTCQVISFIAHLVRTQKDAKPNIIVVPPSTFENWANEFERFAPEVDVFLYTGTDRKELPQDEAMDSDVVLTTYTMVDRNIADVNWLSELRPYAAIFDEGHKLKNPEALVYKNLARLPSQWRLVLSGTPIQNNLKELLSLLSFVEPSLFDDKIMYNMNKIFEARVPNKDVLNFAALAKERVQNARTIMVPFILQRRKDDVLDLPKRTDTLTVVPMLDGQKALYNQLKGNYITTKATKEKGNLWLQLRKAAIHPQLFRRHFTDQKVSKLTDILWKKCSEQELGVQSKSDRHKAQYLDYLLDMSDFDLHLVCKDFHKYIGHLDIPDMSWENAPKVQKLLDLIRSYQDNGDRCLVFSRFEKVIDILREALFHQGINYCDLTGRTTVSERFPEIEKFNSRPDIPVFLLTTGAGGTGLNLTAANKIIIFDQSDNPQDDVQASNRAHRIGQTREVEVIRFITEGTVERLIYNSCIKKLMLAACVGGEVDDDETVEEECRRLMLLGDDGEEVAPSQLPADE